MANRRTPTTRVQGTVAYEGGVFFGGSNAGLFTNAGVPTNGVSGTLAGAAGKGSLVADVTNGKLYINTGTLASPTWTVVGTQT